MAKSRLADDSEIILVEYNPCTESELKEEGSCDERDGGYMGLREAFETLVEVPEGMSGPRVRIMTIPEVSHPCTSSPALPHPWAHHTDCALSIDAILSRLRHFRCLGHA